MLMRLGRVPNPPDLIHSGGSLLLEGQAVTPAPPWRSSPLVVFRVLCLVARGVDPSSLYDAWGGGGRR